MTFQRLPRIPRIVAIVAVVTLVASAAPRSESTDVPDPAIVARIQDEGLVRSQVMDTVAWLTDVHGARLTNSPQFRAAQAWAQQRLSDWQLANVHTEAFPFGRGWSNERLVVRAVSPTPWTITAVPKAWTPGVAPITAELVRVSLDTDQDFKDWTGKLKGRIVLLEPARPVAAFFEPPGTRRTAKELEELEAQAPLTPSAPRAYNTTAASDFARKRTEFLLREGIAAVFENGNGRGDHGAVLVMGPSAARDMNAPATVPQLVLASEHYGRLVRMVDRRVPVTVHLDVDNRFHTDSLDASNLIAEIPGSDRRNEVVMLGAHFDSWHGGTGATDNAAGVAVMMEALRILRALNLPLRRTVRLALWGGEEQGLLGSTAYVREHFADRTTMAIRPDHDRLSVYFNHDNGAGAIRGVFLQGNDGVRPIFRQWMGPFKEWGVGTTTIRPTGDTDHAPFDAVGLPGFQFIQDRLEYFTISHHSSMDLYERVQPDDVKRNAVIVATFAYMAATRDDLLPRKPLPAPRAAR
jgi:carboxypeptidase Q